MPLGHGEPVRITVTYTAEDELLLKLGYRSLIRENLLQIKPQYHNFQDPKPIYFKYWNETEANRKRQLIDNEELYDVLENISKIINDWNNDVNRWSRLKLEPSSSLHLYIQALDKYYEQLKAVSFLT